MDKNVRGTSGESARLCTHKMPNWGRWGPSMGYWEKLRTGPCARGCAAARTQPSPASSRRPPTDGSRADPCRATAAGNRLALRNVISNPWGSRPFPGAKLPKGTRGVGLGVLFLSGRRRRGLPRVGRSSGPAFTRFTDGATLASKRSRTASNKRACYGHHCPKTSDQPGPPMATTVASGLEFVPAASCFLSSIRLKAAEVQFHEGHLPATVASRPQTGANCALGILHEAVPEVA